MASDSNHNGNQEVVTLLTELRQDFREFMDSVDARFESLGTDIAAVEDSITGRIQQLENEVRTLKSPIHPTSSSLSLGPRAASIKIPEPSPFSGVRDAKELENFIWDVEQYFDAAGVLESEKVKIAGLYLTNDAKLWWRTRLQGSLRTGQPLITTWESLKKELMEQFLPGNSDMLAREALRELKHTGSIRDYINQFSSLMLHIGEMAEQDRLFNFLAGLQPWAKVELRRRFIPDLPSAIAAADRLVDFTRPHAAADKKKELAVKNSKPSVSQPVATSEERRVRPRLRCYVCQGPHYARDCPKGHVNALIAWDGAEPSAPEEEEVPARLNPLQLITDQQPTSSSQERKKR